MTALFGKLPVVLDRPLASTRASAASRAPPGVPRPLWRRAWETRMVDFPLTPDTGSASALQLRYTQLRSQQLCALYASTEASLTRFGRTGVTLCRRHSNSATDSANEQDEPAPRSSPSRRLEPPASESKGKSSGRDETESKRKSLTVISALDWHRERHGSTERPSFSNNIVPTAAAPPSHETLAVSAPFPH